MLIEENIIIKPNNHSINHYRNLGYDAKCRIELNIKTSELTKSSNIKVNCICDNCKKITNIKYQDYIRTIEKSQKYFCKDCAILLIKETKKLRYNDENYNNRTKFNVTMMKLYGTLIPLKNLKIKAKKENTCIEKYGFKNASENENIKLKIKNSIIQKYKNDKISILLKRKFTNIKLYNKESYSQTIEYKIKSEITCLKKYNYKHNGEVPELILKRKNTKLKNSKINHNEFYLYKRQVLNISRKNVKILFENWNGMDFYDNEYIKLNFSYKPNSAEYPTVDHKISILYGFKNKMSPIEIGDISNLCVTKKKINSSKKDKCYF